MQNTLLTISKTTLLNFKFFDKTQDLSQHAAHSQTSTYHFHHKFTFLRFWSQDATRIRLRCFILTRNLHGKGK